VQLAQQRMVHPDVEDLAILIDVKVQPRLAGDELAALDPQGGG
jgi:hypothetical protein